MYEQQKDNKQRGGGWLGILIFFLILASQFLPQIISNLSGILGQNTAQQIGFSLANLLPIFVIGLIVFSILWSIFSGITRMTRRQNDTSPIGSGSIPPRMTTEMSSTTLSSGSLGSSRSSGTPSLQSLPRGVRMEIPQEVHLGGTSLSNAYVTGNQIPRGVHLGQVNTQDSFRTSYRLPRDVNMEIPRSTAMEKLRTTSRTPTRAPGFEPIVDGRVLTYGIISLFIGGLVLATGIWLFVP